MNNAILIVEDHDVLRSTVCSWLREHFSKHILLEASSGEQALEMVSTHNPALVLMDVGLPGINGLEATRQIKKLFPQIMIVMLTIHEETKYQQDALESGASGYISKREMHQNLIPLLTELLPDAESDQQDSVDDHAIDLINIVAHAEPYFRTVFDHVRDAIFVESLDGKILDVNQAACQIFGYSREEFLTKTVFDLILPGTQPIMANQTGETLNQTTLETINLRANGEPFPVEITAQLTTLTGMEVMLLVVRDISQRKKTETALQHQFNELTLLHSVSVAGVSIFDEDALLEEVTQVISQTFYPNHFGVMLFDPEKNLLRMHPSYRGISEEIKKIEVPLGTGISGRVAATKKSFRSADVRKVPHFIKATPGMLSELAVPILHGEHLFGVINAESDRPNAFSEVDERLLTTLAGQLALALENVRRYQAERNHAQELESLASLSEELRKVKKADEMPPIILAHIINLVNADGALFGDLQAKTFEVQYAEGNWRSMLGETLSDEFSAYCRQKMSNNEISQFSELSSQPELFSDWAESAPQAVLCMPLVPEGEPIGMIWMNRSLDFKAVEVKILNAVANMAGVALQRARLHDKTRTQMNRLSALRTIDKAIASSTEMKLTLDIVLDQTLDQLGVDAGVIMLANMDFQTLEYCTGQGFHQADIMATQLPFGRSIAGTAVLEQRIRYSGDGLPITLEPSRTRIFDAEGFKNYIAAPLVAKGKVLGVLEVFDRKAFKPTSDWLSFLEMLAKQAAIAIESGRLFEDLQITNTNLALSYDATLEGWAKALELRDAETEGHSRRVMRMTLRLARAMNFSDETLVQVRRGALMHDIGKMGVPDSILLKPGKLTEEEWVVMRKHPVFARQLMSGVSYLNPAMDIPYCHHEKWDGSGYPQGLKGQQIPLSARIFALVDVWDALTNERPYRKAWTPEKTAVYIRERSGIHFDPQVLEICLPIILENEE